MCSPPSRRVWTGPSYFRRQPLQPHQWTYVCVWNQIFHLVEQPYRSARGRNNCKRACVCYMQKNLQREIDSSFLLHDWLSTRTQMTADQVKVEDFKLHRCINYLLRPFCEPLLDISLALMTDLMIVAIGNECEYPPRHFFLLLLSRLNLLQNRSDTIL